ncbi:DUF934 domain-containing protein [Undibacterium squillarum]|uniref:DUF934 domain-containing protein n=1 Tax=Undibacterium squillarum TaxID=1131567 RepID=UPI0035B0E158
MREIIKDRAIVQDDWSVLRLNEGETPETVSVPAGKVIVPLAVWQVQRPALLQRLQASQEIAVWLAPDQPAELIADDAALFPLIAIDFPKFNDGRGYSAAYLLRSRYRYTGELRAIGDVLRDQLFYMQRVGFNAFATRADRSIQDALKGLTDFSEVYQASVDQPLPLFRRTERQAESA